MSRRRGKSRKKRLTDKHWFNHKCDAEFGFKKHDFEQMPSSTYDYGEVLHCRQCFLRVEFDTIEWETDSKIKPRSITYQRVMLDGNVFVNDRSLISFKDQIKRHSDRMMALAEERHLIKVRCLIKRCAFDQHKTKPCLLCAVVKIDALSTMLEKVLYVGKRCEERREQSAWATAGLWAGELVGLVDSLMITIPPIKVPGKNPILKNVLPLHLHGYCDTVLERVGMILPLARDLDLDTEFLRDNPTDEELADGVAIFALGLFDGAVRMAELSDDQSLESIKANLSRAAGELALKWLASKESLFDHSGDVAWLRSELDGLDESEIEMLEDHIDCNPDVQAGYVLPGMIVRMPAAVVLR